MSNETLIGSISEEKEKWLKRFTNEFIEFHSQLHDRMPTEQEISIAQYGYKIGWLNHNTVVRLKLNELES